MALLKDLKVSRRFALRGVLGGIGVTMWLPVLDAMCNNNGTAFAQNQPLPTTFGIWFWGNGIHKELWTPKTTGKGDAWQLPENLLTRVSSSGAQLYLTGTNLITWSHYSGFDPDVSSQSLGVQNRGIDIGAYPLSRGVIVGLNFNY